MIITHSMVDVTILQLFLYTRIIDKNVKTLLLDFRNIIKLKTLGNVLNKEDLDENNFFFSICSNVKVNTRGRCCMSLGTRYES